MDHCIMTLEDILIYMTRNWIPPGLTVGAGRNTTYETRHFVTARPQSKRHGTTHQPGCPAYRDP
jgi:hypothetical protein